MKRFFASEFVSDGILTPAVSPPFSKSENGGENQNFSAPNSIFWNLGEAGGALSLIEHIINFHFRISGNQ